MVMMRTFRCTEWGTIYTEEQLRIEYEEFRQDIEESSGATTFEESLHNALTVTGFLEEIKV
jgi:hypothetical protein